MHVTSVQPNERLSNRSLEGIGLSYFGLTLLVVLCSLVISGCKPAVKTSPSGKTHWQDFLSPSAKLSDAKQQTVGEIKPANSVGSAACLQCHQDDADSYHSTSHYRSACWAQDSDQFQPAKFTHKPSKRSYQVEHSGGKLIHRERIQDSGGELIAKDSAELVFEVGSGLHAHSYLTQRDGFWIQSPLTWYSEPERWDLSPGYQPASQPTFDRVITTKCVFCHVGQIRMFDGDIHRFTISEVSIGCERCHGPGREHVRIQRAAEQSDREDETSVTQAGDGQDIINPLSLSRQAQEAICSQCHLQGAVFSSDSEFNRWDFVPGQLLSDSITEYQVAGIDQPFKIVGHTEQLHTSACYLQSESLTCITCHDPHAGPPTRQEYRKVCIECHQDKHCTLPEADRLRTQNDDCSVCHMPIRPTNVTHAALHDHRIAVHDRSYELAAMKPPEPPGSNSSSLDKPNLAAITDESRLDPVQRERRWAMAMHSLAFQGLMPRELLPELERAKQTLLKLHRRGSTDSGIQVALAKDYLAANLLAPARS